MSRVTIKRTVDMQVLGDWVEPKSRLLDLGCGRGVLLDYLQQTKQTRGIGVDLEFGKVAACTKRGIVAYQGDLLTFMKAFPNCFFDLVICSRTIEELGEPAAVIAEALRVGRRLAIGFANHGYWKNRRDTALHGRKPLNEVYTTEWQNSRPTNPLSIRDFEQYCAREGIKIEKRVHLRGDWKSPSRFLPNIFAGYALYAISR